jgi:mRNA-degrading endonuclease RelE of RelBE toxin-antitoxin system
VPYQLDLSPEAQEEIKRLPGHVRQRMRRVIKALTQDPRPPHSKALDVPLVGAEPRRLRLDRWRIVYAVIETDVNLVAVVAVRQRPPYDYDDLADLFSEL